jgi:hypothetical protein
MHTEYEEVLDVVRGFMGIDDEDDEWSDDFMTRYGR